MLVDSRALGMSRAGRLGYGQAALGLGILALLSQGLLPLLLGLLGGEGRLTPVGIGVTASVESFAITLCAGLAGVLLRPNHLRLAAGLAALLLAIANLAMLRAGSGLEIGVVRGAAGVGEGVLFWIAQSMISREALAERAAAILVSGSTLAALAAAAALNAFVIARFGANGGFAALALVSAFGLMLVPLIPDCYAPLAPGGHRVEMPPPRGWMSLAAIVLFNAAGMGFFIYLVPLAAHAGLSVTVAGTAVTVLLAAQLCGALIATLASGRSGYFPMLVICALLYLVVWPAYLFAVPAWLFLLVTCVVGLVTFFAAPFQYALTIDADPSRRSAVLGGPAQLLGASLGPLIAAWAVGSGGLASVVYLGLGLLFLAMALIVGLRVTRVRVGQ